MSRFFGRISGAYRNRSGRTKYVLGAILLSSAALTAKALAAESKEELAIPADKKFEAGEIHESSHYKQGGWFSWSSWFGSETPKKKKHVVILGTGWAGVAMLRHLSSDYDVTIVSPRNYFLFSPLLPSVTVGTLEDRTIMHPIRKYILKASKRFNAKFFEAKCTDIDPDTNTITCKDVSELVSEVSGFKIAYDYLILAVGSDNNTFGVPGVKENSYFLKSIEDANHIRSRVLDCFETANFPGQSLEEKRRLLSFVIVGGGPTGVEFAGELHDLFEEDMKHYFPQLMPDVSIKILQSQDHILNTFDKKISEFAEEKFMKAHIQVKTGARVKEVKPKSVLVREKGASVDVEVPFGLCLWSTGIIQTSLVKSLCEKLKDKGQENIRALTVDRRLKVKGTENIYAAGDCANVETRYLNKELEQLFSDADTDKSGSLSLEEFRQFLAVIPERYPQLEVYVHKLEKLFHRLDKDKSGSLSQEEFKELLIEADKSVKTLPQTAQVAYQEGTYLAKAFNNMARDKPVDPFSYRHFGSLASLGGGSAVAGELPGNVNSGGFAVWLLWRGVYLSKQHNFRNMFMMSVDWMKAWMFGRDISRF